MSKIYNSVFYVTLTAGGYDKSYLELVEATWKSSILDIEDLALDIKSLFFGPVCNSVKSVTADRFFLLDNYCEQNASEKFRATSLSAFSQNPKAKHQSCDRPLINDYVCEFERISRPRKDVINMILPISVFYDSEAEQEFIKTMQSVVDDRVIYSDIQRGIASSAAMARLINALKPQFYTVSLAPSFKAMIPILQSETKNIKEYVNE